jgi:hypothetical protein
MADTLLCQIYEEKTADQFLNCSELLQAVFSKFAINRDATYLEMQKDQFIVMLKETNIILVPKAKEPVKPAETKKKGAAANK